MPKLERLGTRYVGQRFGERRPLSLTSLVLHRAAVGLGVGVRHGFAGERFVERDFHVVGRACDVGGIWSGFTVNRAFVNNFALGIDDKHVRRVLRAVAAARFAVGIENKRALLRFPFGHFGVGLVGGQVSFKAGRR